MILRVAAEDLEDLLLELLVLGILGVDRLGELRAVDDRDRLRELAQLA